MLDNTRLTFFAPQDDVIDAFLNFVKDKAQKKVRIADYSFVWPALAALLIEKFKNGVDVKLILDKTQAVGRAEAPEVQQMKDAGIPMAIGTSSEHHIMHLKVAILDEEYTESGSYNYTLTAARETNVIDIEHSVDRARVFMAAWQAEWNFIAQNEPEGIFNST